MHVDIKKYIPEQLKNIWFWIYLVIVIVVISILKTDLSHPYKIISLVILVVCQFVYNIKVKYKSGVDIINWILFGVLVLVSLAYLFASFKDYDMAGIMMLLLIALVLISATSSYIVHLWRIKDSNMQNPIIKLSLIIILYLALSFTMIYTISFFFSVAGIFPSNEVVFTENGNKVTELNDMAFFSGTVYYSSVFGNMIPKGFSVWITLITYALSTIIHIIILGIVVASFVDRNKNKK